MNNMLIPTLLGFAAMLVGAGFAIYVIVLRNYEECRRLGVPYRSRFVRWAIGCAEDDLIAMENELARIRRQPLDVPVAVAATARRVAPAYRSSLRSKSGSTHLSKPQPVVFLPPLPPMAASLRPLRSSLTALPRGRTFEPGDIDTCYRGQVTIGEVDANGYLTIHPQDPWYNCRGDRISSFTIFDTFRPEHCDWIGLHLRGMKAKVLALPDSRSGKVTIGFIVKNEPLPFSATWPSASSFKSQRERIIRSSDWFRSSYADFTRAR